MKFLSGVYTKASGSIGGLTYSHNRYGGYVRSRTTPVNPNTDRQSAQRSRLTLLSEQWGSLLSETQRQAWNDYAAQVTIIDRLGQAIHISGYNHFIRSNTLMLQMGASIVETAPAELLKPGADPVFAVSCSEASQLVSVVYDDTQDWADETGAFLAVFMGLPRNTNVNFFGGPWRFAGKIAGLDGTPPTSPQTVVCSFGAVEGQKIWCQARIIRADARVSDPFRDSATVSA